MSEKEGAIAPASGNEEESIALPITPEKTREEWLALLPVEDVDNPLARAYITTGPSMVNVAFFYSRDPNIAEDARQETWRKIVDPELKTNLPSTPDEQKKYLNRAAANYTHDVERKRRRVGMISLDGNENFYSDTTDQATSHGLEGAFAQMDKKYRILLELSIKGYSGREIAQIVGISEGAVKTRLFRAREMLKELSPEARAYAEEVKSSKAVERMPVKPALSDENSEENKE